ncbi:GNAT family N-acetyltransferase [Pseudoduganella ginsengisoli]|uniref:GNAT family N-acetyltransferase n=1 Tax=Pseudoduganella ginsengisoli TaxID=1462440 RepID=A0A6L6Q4G7_9BURK|nr:arsinothricin resistance N-acetyltransferase ArsN1 family B [Pseudoduganella ginsengisoli]MTW03982.1 GNAT family N-acetyltransferase [Pseudoduganella ginsengisoli]
MNLRDATVDDAPAIAAIYNPYIIDTTISFEEDPVQDDEIARRIGDVQAAGLPWLVAEEEGVVIGYAYATKWRVRHAYRHSVESTVYLAPAAARKGVGSALYQALLERLRAGGYHLVIGGIALPNDASVALHEKMGYEKAAHFKEVGFKFGRWLDVGYWQKKLTAD